MLRDRMDVAEVPWEGLLVADRRGAGSREDQMTPRHDMLDTCLQSSLAGRSGSGDATGAYAVTSSNGKRGCCTALVDRARRGA